MLTEILLIICIVLLIVLIVLTLTKSKSDNNQRLEELSRQMSDLTEKNYQQQIKILETLSENTATQTDAVTKAVNSMQESNEKKLDLMRETVDEKLSSTLNKRLNSSFEQVSNQLSSVYKSLGEMKELSDGVSGLNRVLSNVKIRGTWAEAQLGNILEQTIPGMFEQNVKTNPKYNGRVEFAVRIPNPENDEIVYLPIDSKFPMEDYSRLVSASEVGDIAGVEQSRKALEVRIKDEAKAIKNYIAEPYTTSFAVMYLATEGLYAEIMNNRNGLPDKLRSMGILVAGPGTITAMLSSLQLGFSTIAINKKANEVFKILGNAKKQYDMFGDLLVKAKKKIDEAGSTIEQAQKRNDIIQKNLKSVNSLDSEASVNLLD